MLKNFVGLGSSQHAYCMAHGYANILVDMLSFLCDANHKEMTPAKRSANANNLPHVKNATDVLPWLPLQGKVQQFEAMLSLGLVASDMGDGQLRSPIPTRKSSTRAKIRKGIKFVHKFMFFGPMGFMLLEFIFPNTPQRNFVRRVLDFMRRGFARRFTQSELARMDRKGEELERAATTTMPRDFMTIIVHMCLRHLTDTIRKWGPLSESWTMFVEREVRHLKNKTNSNGRDVTRIALADSRRRDSYDYTAALLPLPSYATQHPTGGVANAAGTAWRRMSRLPATDFASICSFIRSEGKYNEADVAEVRSQVYFSNVIEYKGRLHRSRSFEQGGRKARKNCNSVCFVDWGDTTELKRATVAVLNGFYRVKMAGGGGCETFHFAKIRTVKEMKCAYTCCRKIDINSSPSLEAKNGEVILISQIHVSVSPVLLPTFRLIQGQRRRDFDMSFSNEKYWVCPVYS